MNKIYIILTMCLGTIQCSDTANTSNTSSNNQGIESPSSQKRTPKTPRSALSIALATRHEAPVHNNKSSPSLSHSSSSNSINGHRRARSLNNCEKTNRFSVLIHAALDPKLLSAKLKNLKRDVTIEQGLDIVMQKQAFRLAAFTGCVESIKIFLLHGIFDMSIYDEVFSIGIESENKNLLEIAALIDPAETAKRLILRILIKGE